MAEGKTQAEERAAIMTPDPLGPIQEGHVRIYIDYEVSSATIKAGEAATPPSLANRVALYGIVELFKEQKARQAFLRDMKSQGPAVVPASPEDLSRLLGRH